MTQSSTTMVSEIEIVPVKADGGMVGFASFVVDGKFYVGNVAIMQRRDGTGIRLLYPNRNIGGRQIHTLYPIRKEVGDSITKAIQLKYDSIFSHLFENVTDPTITATK